MGTSGLATHLIKDGILAQADCQLIAKDVGGRGAAFAKVVIALGIFDEESLAKYLQEKTSLDIIELQGIIETSPEAVGSIDAPLMSLLEVVPVRIVGRELTVALVDPLDNGVLQQLSFFTDFKIRPAITTFTSIYKTLSTIIEDFSANETSLEKFLKAYQPSLATPVPPSNAKQPPPPAAEEPPERFRTLESEDLDNSLPEESLPEQEPTTSEPEEKPFLFDDVDPSVDADLETPLVNEYTIDDDGLDLAEEAEDDDAPAAESAEPEGQDGQSEADEGGSDDLEAWGLTEDEITEPGQAPSPESSDDSEDSGGEAAEEADDTAEAATEADTQMPEEDLAIDVGAADTEEIEPDSDSNPGDQPTDLAMDTETDSAEAADPIDLAAEDQETTSELMPSDSAADLARDAGDDVDDPTNSGEMDDPDIKSGAEDTDDGTDEVAQATSSDESEPDLTSTGDPADAPHEQDIHLESDDHSGSELEPDLVADALEAEETETATDEPDPALLDELAPDPSEPAIDDLSSLDTDTEASLEADVAGDSTAEDDLPAIEEEITASSSEEELSRDLSEEPAESVQVSGAIVDGPGPSSSSSEGKLQHAITAFNFALTRASLVTEPTKGTELIISTFRRSQAPSGMVLSTDARALLAWSDQDAPVTVPEVETITSLWASAATNSWNSCHPTPEAIASWHTDDSEPLVGLIDIPDQQLMAIVQWNREVACSPNICGLSFSLLTAVLKHSAGQPLDTPASAPAETIDVGID